MEWKTIAGYKVKKKIPSSIYVHALVYTIPIRKERRCYEE